MRYPDILDRNYLWETRVLNFGLNQVQVRKILTIGILLGVIGFLGRNFGLVRNSKIGFTLQNSSLN